MNKIHQNTPLIIRIYFVSFNVLNKTLSLVRACFSGFWLGLFKRETLHLIDEHYYDHNKMFFDEEFNKRGLFAWEKNAVDGYFQQSKRLMVIGAGGGREVLALRRLGYEVYGFECHPRLIQFANGLLRKEGFAPDIELVQRDRCHVGSKIYDGIIVGWSVYASIKEKKQRVAFLKELRMQIKEDGPLLVSFFCRSNLRRDLKVNSTIGNILKRLLWRKDYMEEGDNVTPFYIHYFTQDEITAELEEGGFKIEFYSTQICAHAVGFAC